MTKIKHSHIVKKISPELGYALQATFDTEVDINHGDLGDMPDVAGTNADHDTRYYTETELDAEFSAQRQAGEFSISQQTISGGNMHTISVSLNHSDFTMGQLVLYVPNTARLTSNKRMTSFIMFTTDKNNAFARSGGRKTYNVYGYNFTDYWIKGWYYVDDSRLSDVYFFDDGSQAGLRGQLRIESCQIVGDKIELIFRNTHATRNVSITIKGRFIVYK